MRLSIISALLLAAVSSAPAAMPEPLIWGSDRLAAAMPIDAALAPVREDRGAKMTLPRADCRPGERYLDAVLSIPEGTSPDGLAWTVEIFSTAGGSPAIRSVRPVKTAKAALQFDARSVGSGIIQASLQRGGDTLAVLREIFSSEPEAPLGEGQSADIVVHRPAPAQADAAPWITFGLPMPAGALQDARSLGLFDENGKAVPAQFEPTMWWGQGGSVKWIRVDAMAGAAKSLQARAVSGTTPSKRRLLAKKTGKSIILETGAASYVIEPGGALLNRITAGGKIISENPKGGRGMYVIDQNDRTGTVSAADTAVEIESNGPLVARIKASGIYRADRGEELARFTAWFEFAADRPECRITHHFILTRDTNEIWFKAIGWDFGLVDWAASRGIFAASRGDREAVKSVDLEGREIALAQVQHRRYGGGNDQFVLGVQGDPSAMQRGEMGDWGAALSADRGLLVGCREAARQHPKAFVISPDRVSLSLFHPAGEELDFRSAALVKRWNQGGLLPAELASATGKLATNAIGWSKTHSLLLCPAAGKNAEQSLTAEGREFSEPAEACPAPEWTYRTKVVGPLYPRDTGRFPAVEAFIDKAFSYWAEEQEYLGEYGFVDYFAGPHHTRQFPQSQGRFRASYTLRNAFWLLYLRSAESKYRAMASGTNRTYLDSYLAGWDGPSRQRGLYIHSVGDKDPYAGLPYYWEGFTRPGMGTHTNLDQFLLNYLLTGDPRARDGVLSYIDGVKKWWSKSQSDWRIIAVLRAVNRAYSLTWDPELRIIQEEILNEIYDPKSPVYLTYRNRPYESSTYKTQEDLSALIEGWELHGTRRYRNLAEALSRFWWMSMETGSRFEEGRSGEFLWSLSRNPYYPERLWVAARQEVTSPATSSSAEAEFRFQGLPYALSAVAESQADREQAASWAGVEPLTGNAGLVLRKTGRTVPLQAYLLFERNGLQNLPEIQTLGNISKIGQRLLNLEAGYGDGMTLTLPPESEPADLFIPLPSEGIHRAFLNARAPLLVYADGWWKPSPEKLDPPARIYFQIPAGSRGAAIHFAQDAHLNAPDGSAWPSAETVRGEVALPEDKPGIWSFTSAQGGAVRVSNLPPVFTFENPGAFMEAPPPLPKFPGTPGPSDRTGTMISAGQTLSIQPDKPGLPFREGTIEFFYKPGWDAITLPEKTAKRLLRVATDGGSPWSLVYIVNHDRAGWPGHPWSKSHVLEMEIQSAGPARRPEAMCIRRTIFEKDQWVHVAIVWGQRLFGYTADRTEPSFDVKIFINGKEGKHAAWPRQGNQAAFPPVSLEFGPDFDGEIAGLRISSTQRYTHDFPVPDQVPIDPGTAFLYPLAGNLDGMNREGRPTSPARR